MKKLCMVLSLAGGMAATSVFASVTTTLLDNQSATTGYSYGDGGEFSAVVSAPNNVDWSAYTGQTSGHLTPAQLADANSTASSHNWIQAPGTLVGQEYFQTFCIQTAVYFYPGESYTATTADSITLGTAWLYSKFAAGTLSGNGYNYTNGSGRMTSAGALQQAIWFFQSQSGGAANSYVTAAETALGGTSAAFSESSGAYGVAGFDLTDAYGVAAQEQLFIAVPEATTIIAGALLLLPFGVSTLRILRKQRLA